jgi:hypothetical protein
LCGESEESRLKFSQTPCPEFSLSYARKPMFVDKFGKVVQSTPILRNLLFPVVTHLWKEREERFRRYCRELPKLVPEPFFVKIGANDGITGDPCSDILLGNAS